MLKLETKADLERLITEEIRESLTIEYKSSAALGTDNKKRDELCKDVTAFANSAGGQIIYGIEEDKNVPIKIDDGADVAITKEWIEQVIDSRVQPRIDGLIISPVPLAKGFGFVLTIPQATSRAPHQAPDKKYYKRQNFQSAPMEDYEIRDTLRRATTPALKVALSLAGDKSGLLEFLSGQKQSKPVTLRVLVTNQSPQPAYHTVLYVGLDTEMGTPIGVGMDRGVTPAGYENEQRYWFIRRYASPPEQPIFQESMANPLALNFTVSSQAARKSYFDVTTIVQTPGFATTDDWIIECAGGHLRLYGPNDPRFKRR